MGATQRAALVNRAFVQKYVAGKNPIGLHLGGTDPKDPQWEIVGVVGDTKYATVRAQEAPTAYVPLTIGGATFELRTEGAPTLLMPAVRDAVNRADSSSNDRSTYSGAIEGRPDAAYIPSNSELNSVSRRISRNDGPEVHAAPTLHS